MDPASWEKAKDVISGALKRPPAEREAFVREHCSDPMLRADVDTLLRQYEEASDFLEQSPIVGEPDDLDDLQPGAHVGPYVIVDRLGRGGMGQVFLGHDSRLHRKVALKCLLSTKLSGDDRRPRILNEARAAARINHSNVAAVHDVIEHESRVFIVMEYVEGEGLAARLKRERLPIDQVLAIGRQLSGALAAAHATGIIHGDLKPANIQLTPAGSVKVLDFGLAKAIALVSTTTSAQATTKVQVEKRGAPGGTPGYMSPEQLFGREIDERSDIFSLGVILFEMTTGRRLFTKTDPLDLVVAMAKDPPRADVDDPRVPRQLADVINRALEVDLGDRFQSAVELESALVELEHAQETTPERARPTRSWLRIGGFTAALACAAALLVWTGRSLYVRGRPEPPPGTLAPTKGVRSIAILPFRNVGQSREYEYFGVGLAQVLTGRLTNARFLEVRGPSTQWNSMDASTDPVAVGKQIGVDAVLHGSYQIEAGRLSLSYAVTDVRRNVQIAGDAIQDSFTHAIDVEHRLVPKIIESLKVSASREERDRLAAVQTSHQEAFQAYLHSQYELNRFWQSPSAEQLERSEHYLNESLAVDPGFTVALARLARLHWTAVFWGYATQPGTLERAGREASRAIQQDPGLAEAYATRALVEFQRGELENMRLTLRAALERAPNSPLAHYAAGFYYLGRGLPDRGVRAFLRAQQLDPELVRREVGLAYRFEADFVRAEAQLRRDLDSHPGDVVTAAGLAGVLVARGQLTEARELETKILNRQPQDPTVEYIRALIAVNSRQPFPIDEWVSRHREVYWSDGGYCANVAGVYAIAGQREEAVRWVRRAGELGLRNYPFMARNPFYANLRERAEFKDLLESMKREWEEQKRREVQDPLIPQ